VAVIAKTVCCNGGAEKNTLVNIAVSAFDYIKLPVG
jgi:hypothetical protein